MFYKVTFQKPSYLSYHNYAIALVTNAILSPVLVIVRDRGRFFTDIPYMLWSSKHVELHQTMKQWST